MIPKRGGVQDAADDDKTNEASADLVQLAGLELMNDTKAEAEAVEKILELQELERREREPGPGGMVKHKQLWGEATEETGQLGWGETVAGRLN